MGDFSLSIHLQILFRERREWIDSFVPQKAIYSNQESESTVKIPHMPQSGPNSGDDLFDMAKDGTQVPDNAVEPRYIPSKPRPDEIASASDPRQLGGRNIAEAATNQGDVPRVSTVQFVYKEQQRPDLLTDVTQIPPRMTSSPELETRSPPKSIPRDYTMSREASQKTPLRRAQRG